MSNGQTPQQTREIKDLDQEGYKKGKKNWSKIKGHFIYVDQKTSIFIREGEDEQKKIADYHYKRKHAKP